jgi:DNA-binding LacI/PurR family transcriptional regulator
MTESADRSTAGDGGTTEVSAEQARKNEIEYFVNGERQTTRERKLTAKQILEDAGFAPSEEWLLSRDNPHHEYKDENHEVELHKEERFTATFTGSTETS